MNPIRIFIVDDHPFFRNGVAYWIREQPGLVCCGEAGSITAARRLLPEAKPDVLLLDVQLRDGDGLAYGAEVAGEFPAVRVVVVSQFDEDVFAHRALRSGARGYVMKSEATDTMLGAIKAVMRGELYVSRSVSARVLQNLFPDPSSTNSDLAKLTDRELQVFQMLGAGCKNSEISTTLHISSKTVETYRENLKRKLRAQDAESLVRVARHWVERGELKTDLGERAE